MWFIAMFAMLLYQTYMVVRGEVAKDAFCPYILKVLFSNDWVVSG
jgi:hypothetical protein